MIGPEPRTRKRNRGRSLQNKRVWKTIKNGNQFLYCAIALLGYCTTALVYDKIGLRLVFGYQGQAADGLRGELSKDVQDLGVGGWPAARALSAPSKAVQEVGAKVAIPPRLKIQDAYASLIRA